MTNLPSDAETVATLVELREQIKARRTRQLTLNGAGAGQGEGLSTLRQSVEEVNNLWFVNGSLPITSRAPGIGALLVYLKKFVRRSLRWYIDPLVEQQNRFNSAAARTFVELFAHQERLARDGALLDERIARVEKKIFSIDQESR